MGEAPAEVFSLSFREYILKGYMCFGASGSLSLPIERV